MGTQLLPFHVIPLHLHPYYRSTLGHEEFPLPYAKLDPQARVTGAWF